MDLLVSIIGAKQVVQKRKLMAVVHRFTPMNVVAEGMGHFTMRMNVIPQPATRHARHARMVGKPMRMAPRYLIVICRPGQKYRMSRERMNLPQIAITVQIDCNI